MNRTNAQLLISRIKKRTGRPLKSVLMGILHRWEAVLRLFPDQ